MAQHLYITEHKGKEVEVTAGFDHPMQQFFLVIEEVDPEDDDPTEGRIYSNLDDPAAPDCKDFAYFEQKLDDIGIRVPDSMLEAVRLDQQDVNRRTDVEHFD